MRLGREDFVEGEVKGIKSDLATKNAFKSVRTAARKHIYLRSEDGMMDGRAVVRRLSTSFPSCINYRWMEGKALRSLRYPLRLEN